MSRVKLKNLLIINWRGLFFQTIDMDNTITSLTGQNGAGKTTVMAAAYVALLPDQTLLDIRNQAGSGVSSKKQGLYGRLGTGSISYTILELVGPKQERIFAGVQIRKKSEPDFELIPFVINGIHPEVPSEDIFLKREGSEDVIVDSTSSQGMIELEAICKQYNSRLRTFKGRVGEYMSLLYELGLTPLRLAKTNERKKFNKLLQTSLFGGLSGEIQQSLKEYLLDKDSTLSNQVSRAEQNLSTCKQTRETIDRTELSRKSIEALLRSSSEMGASVLQSAYIKRLKSQRDTLQARSEWNLERKKHQNLTRQLHLRSEFLSKKEQSSSLLRESIAKIRDEIELRRESLRISSQITKTLTEISQYEEKKSNTTHELAALEAKIENMLGEEKRIDEKMASVMRQLIDSTEALSGHARQQSLYKAALAAKENFEVNFPGAFKNTDKLKHELETRNKELSEEIWRLHEWQDQYTRAKARFDETFTLVERLYLVDPELFPKKPEPCPELAHNIKGVLEHWNQLEIRTRNIDNLRTERDLLKSKVDKQKEVLEIAESCGIEDQDQFENFLSHLTEKNAVMRRDLKDLITKQAHLSDEIRSIASKRADLVIEIKNWDKTNVAARAIALSTGSSITHNSNLLEIRAGVIEKREQIYEKKYRLIRDRKDLLDLLSQLQMARVLVDEKMIELSGQLGGDLICDIYDNLDIAQARKKEAEIGPLKSAIHVEDPETALSEYLKLEDKLEEVWFVNHHDLKHQLRSKEEGDWTVSHWGQAIRVAKKPKHPLLGAESREKEIDRIENKLAKFSDEIAEIEVELAQLLQTENTLSAVEQHLNLVGQNDPRVLLNSLDSENDQIDSQSNTLTLQIKVLKEELAEGEIEESKLKAIQIWSVLLNEKDLVMRLSNIDESLLCLIENKARLQATASLLTRLQDRISDLELTQIIDGDDIQQKLAVREQEKVEIGKSIHTLMSYLELREHLLTPQMPANPSVGNDLQTALKTEKDQLEIQKIALRSTLDPMVETKFQLISLKQSCDLMIDRLSAELIELRSNSAFNISGSLEDLDQRFSELRDELNKVETEFTELRVEVRGIEIDLKVSVNQNEKLLSLYKNFRKEQWGKLTDTWKNLKKLQVSHPCFEKLSNLSMDYAHLELTAIASIAGRASAELKKALTEQRQGNRSEAANLFERTHALSQKSILDNPCEVLGIYRDIQTYLEQILPRDIVTSDDPIHALEELKDHIRRLTARLKHHEQDFAVSAFDVAHGIEQKIRKEFRNLAKLNEGLDTIKFGAIRAVRIRYGKKPGMDALLSTMLDQKANQLFAHDSGLTFEEALAKLYESQIGKSFTGESLLDFRHYIDLQIQIRRVGRESWESADSNRLSTGESIGVGLAILIMVLQSWELHTTRLTGKRRDSLRFLFLDEASRLDSNSINTLAGLCRDMELQLLIAAPMADQAVSGTTYSLTRLVDDVFGEQVIMRGLRGFGQKVAFKQLPEEPVQVSIWGNIDENAII